MPSGSAGTWAARTAVSHWRANSACLLGFLTPLGSNRGALFQPLSSGKAREGREEEGKASGLREGPLMTWGSLTVRCFCPAEPASSWSLSDGIFTSWENLFSCLIKRLVVTLGEWLGLILGRPSVTGN